MWLANETTTIIVTLLVLFVSQHTCAAFSYGLTKQQRQYNNRRLATRLFHTPTTATTTTTISSNSTNIDEAKQRQQQDNMGLTASSPVVPSTTKNKEKNGKQEEYPQEWVDVVNQYVQSTLDPSYLHYPIRGSIVNAALQYPSGDKDSRYLLPGTHKHLGGVEDPTDGCIYGVPANAHSILCLYPSDEGYKMKTIPLPEEIQNRHYKWLRGLIVHGCLWAIPSWANAVLCVDLDAYWGRREATNDKDVVQLIPLPENHPKEMRWQWHGGALNKDQTAIYCVPSNAKQVLKVDIINKKTSLIEIEYNPEDYPDFTLDVANKWYGGMVGADHAIYGSPYRASGTLRMDPSTDTAVMMGPDRGVGHYYWHGGIVVNGKIYHHPSHASTVLVTDTTQSPPAWIELPIQNMPQDGKNYKWLGGAIGADGNIYCPACDTTQVLKINVTTDYCETIAVPTGTEKNKWQGGILSKRDNCIYCIPANGVHGMFYDYSI